MINKHFYRKEADIDESISSPLLLTPTYEQKTKISDRSEANDDENEMS